MAPGLNIYHHLNRYFVVLLIAILLAIVTSSFFAISSLLDKMYTSRQASLSPFFSLIIDTILKPVYVSQTMAKDPLFADLLLQQPADKEAIFNYLNSIQSHFDTEVFVASEAHQVMYSENQIYPSDSEPFAWYPRLKVQNIPVYAGIGNPVEPHFYIDVRMEKDDQLVGYVGTGVSLVSFVDEFSHLHSQFNSAFYFVNEREQIVLSSDQGVKMHDDATRVFMANDYPWFQEFDPTDLHQHESITTLSMKLNGRDVLVSRIAIRELGWNLYVLTTPRVTRQELISGLITSTLFWLTLFSAILLMGFFAYRHYSRLVVKEASTDQLTGLLNRSRLEYRYNKLPEDQPLSLIILDIDHFKSINDQHGHNIGDQVLKEVATGLTHIFRQSDSIARWGGEEFVILLPKLNAKTARTVAERCRHYLAITPIQCGPYGLSISASLGVVSMQSKQTLTRAIDVADKALYEAKNNGRNQVISCELD